jgi:hypothetical protein
MSLEEVINRGVVGINDRVSNMHPEDWTDSVIKEIQWQARMVAFIEANSKRTESQTYHWWEQGPLNQGGTITDVYTDAGLASAYASGGVSGTPLYIKMALADASKIREDHLLFMYDATGRLYRRAKVNSVTLNGASSYAAVTLLETDTSNALASASLTFVLSNASAEKSTAPSLISRDPVQRTNYAQFIFDADGMTIMESLEKERATPKNKARAAKNLSLRFREAKQLNFILGKYFAENSTLGRWQTTTGFIPAMETHEPDNVFDFKDDADITAGATWAQEGMDFLEKIAEITSRTGEAEKKVCFTSTLMLNRIQAAIRERSNYNIAHGADKYGLAVTHLTMTGQDWELRADRTMSKYAMLRDLILVTEPQLLGQRVFKPMKTHEVPMIHANDPWQLEMTEISGFQWQNLEAMAVVKYAAVHD